MRRVVSAFLVLLQAMAKSDTGINADQLTVPPVKVINASISQLYDDQLTRETEFQFDYFYTEKEVEGGALRVYAVADGSDSEAPVLVVVRHEKGVLSWQLPMVVQEQEEGDTLLVSEFTATNRTLCPIVNYQGRQYVQSRADLDPFPTKNMIKIPNGKLVPDEQKRNLTKVHRLTVGLSTSSLVPVNFSVMVTKEEPYYVGMDSTVSFEVTPSAPRFFQFNFPDGIDTAIISMNSPGPSSEICMTMSVQNISCPVYDLDRDVHFEGSFQTVDSKTGMSIRKDQYPNGLHIVFVVKPTNLACVNSFNLNPFTPIMPPANQECHGPCRKKTVEFKIMKKITKQEYLYATFGALGLFLGTYILVVLVSCIMCVRTWRVPTEPTLEDQPVPGTEYGSIQRNENENAEVNSIDYADDDSSMNEEDIDMLTDAEFDKDVFRTKTFLFVADLARKSPSVLRKKSQLYQWNLLTIAIFYGLPVVQLVVTYQTVLNQTGNEDLCYYNFLCAHPLGALSDFNHVFSNIGYVMLGGLFMIFVWRRELLYRQLVEKNPRMDRKYGIPQHSGMFYAMGFALVMEGMMSGSYHICPNHSNFQFDTAFMYTIAILCMLKIYQFRHPDINANAYTACGVLAFVIFIGVLGVVEGSGNIPFWTAFTGLYVVSCFLLSIQIYYMGRWKVDMGLPRRVWQMVAHDVRSCCSGSLQAMKPMYPDRMFLLAIFNMANWGMAGYGIAELAENGGDFASYLLYIFIGNLLLYTSFYILMKLRYGEKITKQPATYLLLSWVSWAGAIWFFVNKSTSWFLSPAESRRLNTECELFHFYDNHDIWHFLSATSLFLNFMMLLTIDDDLHLKPREQIPVF